ncbi:MFS transporter [Paenibacillus sambharensis]|uniref:MFS transporter n=1 Tax=Paenibacillus sambharensis TaxID=1803190 RepID=A0A2W1L9M6_9BACL|nr:MFS transporter [Paenibacillus sambharensis]PZD95946.1 MFS transporter [Paenibacillus sambharensis]
MTTYSNAAANEPGRSSRAGSETALLRIYCYLFYSTVALIVSYFPLYFADQGYSPSEIGLIYAVGPAVSIAANLLTGTASDKYRTIKKLLVILFIGQLIMLAALMQAGSFIWVFLIMAGFYFFQTPVMPLSDSMILLSTHSTGRNYPSIRIFGSIGFACSAFLIGLLLKAYGSGATLWITITLVSLTLGVALMLRDYQGSLKKMEFSGLYKLLAKPRIVLFFLLILIVSVAHRMYEGFLALTLREMGASEGLIGTAWFASALSEIPVLFLLGKYGHKLRELPLLAFASLMYAARFFMMSRIDDPSFVIVLQLMHSISFGIYFSTALRYLTFLIPDEYRASGQAIYAIVWAGFAGLISGTAGGMLFESMGPHWFYAAASGLALSAGIGFMLMHVTSRTR